MPPSLFYWIGFFLYAAVVIVVGFKAYRKRSAQTKIGESSEYWTAGQSLSAGATGLSISASMMSISWSCVYGVQLFYWYGLGALWLLAIPWLLAMAGFFILTPHLRKLQAFSQPEMVGARFSVRARQMLALPLAFVYLIWCGAEIYAAAQIVAPLLQTSLHLMLALIALVVAIYSFLGGFAAVVSTDKIQFALVGFFIVTIAFLGVNQLSNNAGLAANLSELTPPPKGEGSALSLLTPGWALIIMTFVAYMPGWLVTTDVWIRLQAAKSTRAARKGVAIAAFNSFVFVTLAPLLIGLAALYLYPPQNGAIPIELADGAAIFPVMMQDFAPVGLNVVLTVGLIAAAMSTIDTTGNVMALSISYDLVEPSLKTRLPQSAKDNLPRYISVAAIGLAYVYAIFTESLWDIFYLSSGVLTTTIFIPMAAIFLPSTKPQQVHAAIITGFVSTLIFYFWESHGSLAQLEPAWLAETGIGYILWGLMAAVIAFLSTGFFKAKSS